MLVKTFYVLRGKSLPDKGQAQGEADAEIHITGSRTIMLILRRVQAAPAQLHLGSHHLFCLSLKTVGGIFICKTI